MKIEQDNSRFNPVTITLETPLDVAIMYAMAQAQVDASENNLSDDNAIIKHIATEHSVIADESDDVYDGILANHAGEIKDVLGPILDDIKSL